MWNQFKVKLHDLKEYCGLCGHRKKLARKTDSSNKEYRDYLELQITRTYSKRDSTFPERSRELIDRVSENIDIGGFAVLCVGCRNVHEINYLKNKRAKRVIGIDLYSEQDDILVMDMHDMAFADSSFDMIYSSHSLEHALDTKKAVREFVRVVRDGGYIVIEVPVNYMTQGADLVDFQSLEHLHEVFKDYLQEIRWSESVTVRNDSGDKIISIRTIMRIHKDEPSIKAENA